MLNITLPGRAAVSLLKIILVACVDVLFACFAFMMNAAIRWPRKWPLMPLVSAMVNSMVCGSVLAEITKTTSLSYLRIGSKIGCHIFWP